MRLIKKKLGALVRNLLILLTIGVFVTQFFGGVVSAVDENVGALCPQDKRDLAQNIYYFNACTGCDSSAVTTSTGTLASNPGEPPEWNSNVQQPYYLEEFVINVLEDIATIEKVPTTDAVTQQHVLALVAWAYAEGGNIANTDVFNPWNTGIDDPALLASAAAGNGVQSFNSFNAGVSAAADTMTGSNQNRIAQTLIDPTSSAGQFMQNLTYYQNFSGNTFWAAADQNATVDGTAYTQTGYLNSLNSDLSETTKNYAEMASVEIGPGQEDTNHYSGTLKYSGGTASPTGTPTVAGSNTSGSSSCGNSAAAGSSVTCQAAGQASSAAPTGNAAIPCDAEKYDTLSYNQGWHSSGSVFHARCNATYPSQAPPAVGPGCATDCSGLVNLVLYDLFGNDVNETTYTEVSDTVNFEKIDASKLMPGDFIQPEAEHGDHVMILVSLSGNQATVFEARTENAPQPQQVEQNTYTLASGDVYLRYIGTGSTYPK
ncbi:MAG: hypothetical protein WDN66_00545 [Candidatus Saccharibacteria bacterium]